MDIKLKSSKDKTDGNTSEGAETKVSGTEPSVHSDDQQSSEGGLSGVSAKSDGPAIQAGAREPDTGRSKPDIKPVSKVPVEVQMDQQFAAEVEAAPEPTKQMYMFISTFPKLVVNIITPQNPKVRDTDGNYRPESLPIAFKNGVYTTDNSVIAAGLRAALGKGRRVFREAADYRDAAKMDSYQRAERRLIANTTNGVATAGDVNDHAMIAGAAHLTDLQQSIIQGAIRTE